MGFKINLGVWNGVFCVPNEVADNCLKLAGAGDLKVLLFLLRNCGQQVDINILSDNLSLSAEQVEESIDFWIQRGIIERDGSSELVPARTGTQNTSSAFGNVSAGISKVKKIELERTPDFAPAEIADRVKEQKEAEYLFKHCEALYGRPLKHNEQRTLMLILDDACLPVEAAMILIDYCFSVNKATPAYMRTLAQDWVNSDITTIEKAEQKSAELRSLEDAVGRFKKMFEVTSAFSKQQRDFIDKWVNYYGFSDEMINEAYQITMDSTGKLAFKYMNRILEDWHSKGILTPEQISNEKRPSAKAEKGENSSFDIEKLERLVSDEV